MPKKTPAKKPAKSPVAKAVKKVVAKVKATVNKANVKGSRKVSLAKDGSIVSEITRRKPENGKSAVVVTQTDAAQRISGEVITTNPPIFHASHAEAVQAAENSNKEFVAEIVPQPSVLEVARQAWGEVKGASDPDFDACVSTHRERFLFLAESIIKGSSPMNGDTIAARFERKVSELIK